MGRPIKYLGCIINNEPPKFILFQKIITLLFLDGYALSLFYSLTYLLYKYVSLFAFLQISIKLYSIFREYPKLIFAQYISKNFHWVKNAAFAIKYRSIEASRSLM